MQPGCAQQLRFFERDFSAYSSFWRPTNVVHAVVPACVLTATVLLVLVTTVDRSAPDYQALAWADASFARMNLLPRDYEVKDVANVSKG